MKMNSTKWVTALLLLAADYGVALGQTEPEVTRVEEDWRVYIVEPDEGIGVPHLANVIAPDANNQTIFGLVELNHSSQPSFTSGGCQVQGWVGESLASFAETDDADLLTQKFDRLEYTVGLSKTSAGINIFLKDGKSRSWGRFAQTPIQTTIAVANPTLANYDPVVSVANTSINHGANRVALMFQVRVRYYNGNTLLRTDSQPRVLHRFQDLIQYVSLEEYEQNSEFYNITIEEEN